MHKTSIDIPELNRIGLVDLLNQTLADISDLQMSVKNAHWNVKGMEFIALHKFFDEVAEEVEFQVDIVAERVTSLGGTALGTLQDTANGTKLKPYPADIFECKDHLRALTDRFAICARSARQNIQKSEGLGDMATNDLYIDLTRMLDKNLWFIEAHLQS